MHRIDIAEHQRLLVKLLSEIGLSVGFSDDLAELLATYARVTGTGYVQRPFVLEEPNTTEGQNFWVAIHAADQVVSLTAFRTLSNAHQPRRVGSIFSEGGLYLRQGTRLEGWRPESGPIIDAGELFGYIGAGWVHPDWRGRNLIGFATRLAQGEALVRCGDALSLVTSMSTAAVHHGGVTLRACGTHHMHEDRVLDGYFEITDGPTEMFMTYSTAQELRQLYLLELQMLRERKDIPWLQGHSKARATDVLFAGADVGHPSELETKLDMAPQPSIA